VAEGGGLLNRCTVKSCTGGSNPPLSAIQSALRAFSLHNAQKCVNSGQVRGSRSLNMNRRLSLPASCGQIIPIFSGTTRSGTFRVAKRTACGERRRARAKPNQESSTFRPLPNCSGARMLGGQFGITPVSEAANAD
jgi:hypothetical protein